MRFRVSSSLGYFIDCPSTIICNIHAIRNASQTVLEESFNLNPSLQVEELVSTISQNRSIRFETGYTPSLELSYNALVDVKYQSYDKEQLASCPIGKLDEHIIPYLFPSRYCQSDRLGKLAYDKFGYINSAFERVMAISDWIFKNVTYVSGSTTSQTSAFDTVTQRAGVCRDFAHLGIALCRALSIPARYFSGYAYKLNPPDFHACFEAYLGGKWIIFDATRLAPLNGLVRVATGRDAADAAVASSFGEVRLNYMNVANEVADNNFESIFYNQNSSFGISVE